MNIAYALGGVLVGWATAWFFVIRTLVNDIRQMRYTGFKADLPMPEKPQLPRIAWPNEGLG